MWPLIAALVAGGVAIWQSYQNNQNQEAAFQRETKLAWDIANYNDPVNQRARLKKAGYNGVSGLTNGNMVVGYHVPVQTVPDFSSAIENISKIDFNDKQNEMLALKEQIADMKEEQLRFTIAETLKMDEARLTQIKLINDDMKKKDAVHDLIGEIAKPLDDGSKLSKSVQTIIGLMIKKFFGM